MQDKRYLATDLHRLNTEVRNERKKEEKQAHRSPDKKCRGQEGRREKTVSKRKSKYLATDFHRLNAEVKGKRKVTKVS